MTEDLKSKLSELSLSEFNNFVSEIRSKIITRDAKRQRQRPKQIKAKEFNKLLAEGKALLKGEKATSKEKLVLPIEHTWQYAWYEEGCDIVDHDIKVLGKDKLSSYALDVIEEDFCDAAVPPSVQKKIDAMRRKVEKYRDKVTNLEKKLRIPDGQLWDVLDRKLEQYQCW